MKEVEAITVKEYLLYKHAKENQQKGAREFGERIIAIIEADAEFPKIIKDGYIKKIKQEMAKL